MKRKPTSHLSQYRYLYRTPTNGGLAPNVSVPERFDLTDVPCLQTIQEQLISNVHQYLASCPKRDYFNLSACLYRELRRFSDLDTCSGTPLNSSGVETVQTLGQEDAKSLLPVFAEGSHSGHSGACGGGFGVIDSHRQFD